MTDDYILRHVDHTLLKPSASLPEIEELCREAGRYNVASVCIPPAYVKIVNQRFDITVCTVIGFPLGYDVTAAKETAAASAIADGADELDMVINLTDVKNGAFDRVRDEIAALKRIAGKRILKVIVETCYLTDDEKIALCHAVTEAGADFIKTSTGFGTAGAVIEDIRLFKKHIGPDVKIKAAGGIRSRQDMVMFLDEGCSRLGTSSAVKLLSGQSAQGY